jgi:hypothetical protein
VNLLLQSAGHADDPFVQFMPAKEESIAAQRFVGFSNDKKCV